MSEFNTNIENLQNNFSLYEDGSTHIYIKQQKNSSKFKLIVKESGVSQTIKTFSKQDNWFVALIQDANAFNQQPQETETAKVLIRMPGSGAPLDIKSGSKTPQNSNRKISLNADGSFNTKGPDPIFPDIDDIKNQVMLDIFTKQKLYFYFVFI